MGAGSLGESPDFYNPIQYSIEKRPFFRFDFPGLAEIQLNFSQLHQDMFVLCTLGGKREGSYLEIGAHEPLFISNTYLLEQQFGWQGLGLELDAGMVARHQRLRRNPCLQADALTLDIESCLQAAGLPAVIDYLSLDIDPPANSLRALQRLPHQSYRFRVITFEHDLSFGGSAERVQSRRLLRDLGYELLVADVSWCGHVVEDWWVDPSLTDPEIIRQLRPTDPTAFHRHDSFFYAPIPGKKPNQRRDLFHSDSGGDMLKKGICVEGWRDLNHSYALVNQWQLLELLQHPVRLCHRDTAPWSSHWNARDNGSGLPAELQERIRSIPSPGEDELFSVIYRIGCPFNLAAGPAERIFVFGTSEWGECQGRFSGATPEEARRRGDLAIVTPSEWSKEGFLRSGFDSDDVHVIPHGVAPSVFYRVEPALRMLYRQMFGFGQHEFVLLNVGATRNNKGTDLLLLAYALLKAKYPQLRLVIKDQSTLYGHMLDTVIQLLIDRGLSQSGAEMIRNEVTIISDNLDLQGLMALYNASDLYVSPYRAEGFNLTPLEAAACGVPILVTAGGPTDGYFDPRLGLQIASELRFRNGQMVLEPDLEALQSGIETILRQPGRWGGPAGSAWVHERHGWQRIGEQLWRLLTAG